MKKFLLILLIAVLGLGCEKENETSCEDLKIAVKTDDIETVKDIVTLLAFDLEAKVTAEDPTGNYNNFKTLIERLNGECDVTATEICYGCIYTLPETSEIELVIPLGTHSVTRVLDIAPNQAGKLICTNMHE
jgi:hypothetical protein